MLRIAEQALTFDDVVLVPEHSDILPKDVDLKTRLTKNISLNIPLVSAAMDTVTESKMGIAISELGGIGVIHKNLSIQDQATEVRKVKKYESGVVRDPITIRSDKQVGELIQLTNDLSISGMPVVDDGELVGIVTSRDFRNERNLGASVAEIMTPKNKLVTAKEGEDLEVIKALLQDNRIEKILLVDEKFELTGLVTLKDINKSLDFPNAARDSEGRLIVGAAIGTKADTLERASALIESGVDVLVVDSAHGHSKNVLDIVKLIKKEFKDIEVIGGNVATPEGALELVKSGVDSVKIGMGPGSICTTRLVAGIGVPQLSAIISVKKGIKNKNIKIISDGGIKYSGDLAKAFAAGADAVMIGSLFAGTDETPGKLIKKNGKMFKSFRGMGSVGAMNKGSADRYFQTKQKDNSKYVPEGVEGFVKYKGKVSLIIYKLIGGLKSSMGYLGSKEIVKLRTKANFVKITKAGFYESMVHSVEITQKTINYKL